MNEHICASSVFVYSLDNISGSAIDFRQRSDFDEFEGCEEEEWDDKVRICGMSHGQEAYQYLDRVPLREGRLVAFSNVLKTRQTSVQLVDSTKRGHCSFLKILLVDPFIRIFSTTNVPPRQRDWWTKALYPDPSHRLGILPAEIFNRNLFFAYDYSYTTSPEQAREEKAERDTEFIDFEFALNRHVQTVDPTRLRRYNFTLTTDCCYFL